MGNQNTKSLLEYSTIDRGPAKPTESPVFRCPINRRIDPAFVATSTLYSFFQNSVARFGTRPFLGTRENLQDGTFGRYTWETYAQVVEKVNRFADSLPRLVDLSSQRLPTFGIYCKARSEWVIADLACMAQSFASVILFDTLGFESIAEVIKATRMRAMALSSINKSIIYHLKREGEIPSLVNLVQLEPINIAEKTEAEKLGLNLYSFGDLISGSSGSGEKRIAAPETVYSVCYTSGTYGSPSGVVVKHRQMASMIIGVTSSFSFNENDVYLSYLPQAHIMERSLTYIAMFVGAAIGFYAGNMSRIRDDMQILHPTLFAAVPRIIYKMTENIRNAVNSFGGMKQSIFKRALKAKQKDYRTSGKLKNAIWDALVFSKIRATFGGRVRLVLVGGAPISVAELEFMRLVLSVPILEGYGLTESCACSFVTAPDDNEMGHVGGPLSMLEAKMIDAKTSESGAITGELCLRGPQVSTETYLPPKNADEPKMCTLTDEEGWLHTGDIVTRLPHNGAFKVVDRVKNVFKLSHGEYITPEKIEVCYKCPSIDFILVYGNPLKSYLVAVVVPNESKLRAKFTKLHNTRPDVAFSTLCADPEAKQYILDKISSRSARYHLNVYEQVRNILLVPALDAQLFTHVGKPKPHETIKFFSRELEALYEEDQKSR